MRFISAVFFALIASVSAVSVPFTTCGSGDFVATAVDVNPYPPTRGSSVQITTKGHLASQVSGGNFEVDVTLGGITVLKQSGDMCKFSTDLKCPQPAGDLTAGYKIDVPAIAPDGKYQIVFKGTQQDGKQLFCIQSEFQISGLFSEMLVSNVPESNTAVPFSNCAAGDLVVKAVDVTPFPPVKGQTSKIIATGILASQVTGGDFEVDVNFGGITVLKKSGDICQFSPDVSCPAPAGDIKVSYALDVPSIAPNGKYQIVFKGTQQDKKTLFCVTSEFEINSNSNSNALAFNFDAPLNALVPSSANTAVPFDTCEAGTTFTAKSVDVAPFPPLKGKDAKITVAGNLAAQVTGGSFEVDVSLAGITVLKQSGDLCKFSSDLKCPQPAGDIVAGYTMNVPAIAPDGTYDIKFRGVEQAGKTVFCITSKFDLKSFQGSNLLAVNFTQPPSNTPVPYSSCGTGDFSITGVDVSPFPPVKGQKVNIVATGNLASQVTAGTFEVDVQLAGITVLKQSGDICKFSKDVTCPSKTGPVTLSYQMDVPSIAPPGTYDIVFKGTQQDGKSLYCVKSSFQL